ncbi:MAG TPA: hypothetical protein ENK02_14935 [Planctomycetes bacterium]|nr:hypothetical protein [Planctomycetota bacterium]
MIFRIIVALLTLFLGCLAFLGGRKGEGPFLKTLLTKMLVFFAWLVLGFFVMLGTEYLFLDG